MSQSDLDWYKWDDVQAVILSKFPTGEFVQSEEKDKGRYPGKFRFYDLRIPSNKMLYSSFVVYSFAEVEYISENNLSARLHALEMSLDDFK